MSQRAGYVLVGGQSSRMGRDKATLPYRDRTLAEAIAETVAAAVGSAVMVGNSNHLPAIPDLYPHAGPLSGVLTALAHSTADWNLIVACDMPGLRVDFLQMLADAAERSEADVLVPCGPSGLLEPLCAVYHRHSQTGLLSAFSRGVRKMATALEEVGLATLPVQEVAFFQNVNTPKDWAIHER